PAVEFFLVNPVQPPVQNLVVAVTGQGSLAALHAQVFDVKIAATNKAHHAAVGTETLTHFFLGAAGQADSAVAAELVVEKIVGKSNQRAGLAGIQLVESLVR